MIWCNMVQMIINEHITWRNQCIRPVIRVEKVWDIGGQGLGKNPGLKTQDKVTVKQYKESEGY